MTTRGPSGWAASSRAGCRCWPSGSACRGRARRRPRHPGGRQPDDRRLCRAVRPVAGQVEIAYYADDFVVLHEAAHAWFNGALLADRWANEAFASYYVSRPPGPRRRRSTSDTLARARGGAHPAQRVGRGRLRGRRTEDYAYAATLALAREIADRAGDDGLRAGLGRRRGGSRPAVAYQPTRGRRLGIGPRDRRWTARLARPARSARGADRVATTTCGGPGCARRRICPCSTRGARREPSTRRGARRRRRLAAVAPVRDAMRAWRFDATRRVLDARGAVLERGRAISTDAAAAGLTVPDTLRTAFEATTASRRRTLRRTPS